MAGLPVSAFLANLYLKEMNQYFWENKILYARYSDDIIIFSKTETELQKQIEFIESTLEEHGLSVNQKNVVKRSREKSGSILDFHFVRE